MGFWTSFRVFYRLEMSAEVFYRENTREIDEWWNDATFVLLWWVVVEALYSGRMLVY